MVLSEVTAKNPCHHCGKPDWCYSFSNGSSVCNRDSIGHGWADSGKQTKSGHAILWPESWEGKSPAPKVIDTDYYYYSCRDDIYSVKVVIQRLDNGSKKCFQQFSRGKGWLKTRPKGMERADIRLYKYEELTYAIEHGITIFICEGEKCAEALLSLGLYATTNIQGCKGFSESDLKDLGDYQNIVLVPDRDQPGMELMEKWAKLLPNAQWLYPYPAKDWVNIPPDNGMDVFDWIQDFKLEKEDIRSAIAVIPESLKPKEVKPDKPKKERNPVTRYNGSKNLNSKELLDFVDNELGDRLAFDEFRCKLYLDDKELKLGTDIEFWFLREFGESATDKKIYNAIVNAAKENSYHPVKEYLENCRKVKPISIKDIATRHFGQSDPTYNLMVELWLISAIARAFEPGCQADHCLVLQGGQGKGKTTWLNKLFGNFFTNSISKDNFGTPNSIMTCHVVWCAELAEIDSILKSKEAGLIKSFITTREDFMRKPYLREVDNYPRPCIFAGTVNPKRFLQDDENRRFWPIPIGDDFMFDLPLLEQERDGLFHSALLAYESGTEWWPNPEQKEAITQILSQFLDTDAWLDIVEGYLLSHSDGVSIMQILTDCLGFPEKDCKRAEQNRVIRILTHLGWTEEGRRANPKTGASERIRKPKPKKSSQTDGYSGHCGKSLTQQALQNSESGKEVVSSGNDQQTTTTLPGETHTQSGVNHSDHNNRLFSEKNKQKKGTTKQTALDLDQLREELLGILEIVLAQMGIGKPEAKTVMGDIFEGRNHTAQLSVEEIAFFTSFLRGETYAD